MEESTSCTDLGFFGSSAGAAAPCEADALLTSRFVSIAESATSLVVFSPSAELPSPPPAGAPSAPMAEPESPLAGAPPFSLPSAAFFTSIAEPTPPADGKPPASERRAASPKLPLLPLPGRTSTAAPLVERPPPPAARTGPRAMAEAFPAREEATKGRWSGRPKRRAKREKRKEKRREEEAKERRMRPLGLTTP
ncbi:hypothetical protein EE612_016974 [Oryza sativa]|nr:hypothetical protein EE612_016974 [Oryza sativa]